MAAGANIVRKYEIADYEGRVDIMLDNFDNFNAQIELVYEGIKYRIREERAYARRSNMGELGVRVQTSGVSSTTEKIAIENIEIENALKGKDFDNSIFKNVEELDEIKRSIYIMEIMEMDYNALVKQMKLLKKLDREVLLKLLDEGMEIQEIASEAQIEYESVRTRVKRARARIKVGMIEFWNENKRRDF